MYIQNAYSRIISFLLDDFFQEKRDKYEEYLEFVPNFFRQSWEGTHGEKLKDLKNSALAEFNLLCVRSIIAFLIPMTIFALSLSNRIFGMQLLYGIMFVAMGIAISITVSVVYFFVNINSCHSMMKFGQFMLDYDRLHQFLIGWVGKEYLAYQNTEKGDRSHVYAMFPTFIRTKGEEILEAVDECLTDIIVKPGMEKRLEDLRNQFHDMSDALRPFGLLFFEHKVHAVYLSKPCAI